MRWLRSGHSFTVFFYLTTVNVINTQYSLNNKQANIDIP